MTFNSLTEKEERDIPSQISKISFGLHILDPNLCGF